MSNSNSAPTSTTPPPTAQPLRTEGRVPRAYLKAEVTQLGIQVRLLDGKKQTWPYAQLSYHTLEGGKLTVAFSEHIVIIRGRHLEGADEGLCLQSLVYLQENGTRQQEVLGEPEIPEDQSAIDSIEIHLRS